MYKEINNYQLFDTTFTFPVTQWQQLIKIDCTDNAVLYPANDVGQWVACIGSWITVEATFIITQDTDLILTDYIHNQNISFWKIEITETGSILTPNSIFTSQSNLQEFYLFEAICVIIIALFLFWNKTLKSLKY